METKYYRSGDYLVASAREDGRPVFVTLGRGKLTKTRTCVHTIDPRDEITYQEFNRALNHYLLGDIRPLIAPAVD